MDQNKNMKRLKSALIFFGILLSTFVTLNLQAQTTPTGANTDAACGADCWDIFSWSPADDGTGGNIPGSGEGQAADNNCNTIIDAGVDYVGGDTTPDFTGTAIGANTQNGVDDTWTLSFADALTNPVISFSAIQNFAGTANDTKVYFTDCSGAEITGTCIASCGTQLIYTPGMGWSGDPAASIQLDGTFDCLNITFDLPDGDSDAYTFNVGTCLGADLPPPCVDCPANNSYRYLSLSNATGKVVGSTADVNLNGTLYGTATILETSVTNPDILGTTFGGYDTDGGSILIEVALCTPIAVQQLDIIGLETESQIWIGNSLAGNIPADLALEACGGTKGTMLPTGNMVTNTSVKPYTKYRYGKALYANNELDKAAEEFKSIIPLCGVDDLNSAYITGETTGNFEQLSLCLEGLAQIYAVKGDTQSFKSFPS